jgi:hypothetical protein
MFRTLNDTKGFRIVGYFFQQNLRIIWANSYLFTASLKALPAENFGSFFAGILIVASV